MVNLQRLSKVALFIVGVILLLNSFAAQSAEPIFFNLNYKIALDPLQRGALVTISVDKGELLNQINFDNQQSLFTNIKANGKLTTKAGRVFWELPKGAAALSYFITIPHQREPGKFDAIMNQDWALFRGDEIIPAFHSGRGEFAKATLEFVLPKDWKIQTGWPKVKGRPNTFIVDNPDRRVDRPTGWMIAGKTTTRYAKIKGTSIAVTAPSDQHYQRMVVLTFLKFTWSEVYKAFKSTPEKLLIVGAGDPMWRGGLSAPNSLFLHSDRPLVSENGTSPLLHELTHMVTRITGAETHTGDPTKDTDDDWIAEGLAEYYSFELLYRAHGITMARRAKIIKSLEKWSHGVEHLRKTKSTGQNTARAALIFDELDKEIRLRSKDKYTLDDVTRQLMVIRKVSLNDLRHATEILVGPNVKVFNSPVLR